MNLILVNTSLTHKEAFQNYVQTWAAEKMNPREDYYKMYQRVFEDYEAFLAHLVNLRHPDRLKNAKPFIRFYWFFNEAQAIVGTLRYRINIPEEYGNIGYEISPQYRNQGYGRKMLGALKEQLQEEGIESFLLTLSPENKASQKIIEYNGGRFVKQLEEPSSGDLLNMYQIVL